MDAILFILGLAFLIGGAELLVRGASRLAMLAGISPLVVGLTVVAFGTSAPEFAVTMKAAIADQANISTGNVVGSNIFNVLFILGLSSLIVPLVVSPQLIRVDVPLMIGTSVLAIVLAIDGRYTRLDGAIFFGSLIGYVALLIVLSRREAIKAEELPVSASEDNLKFSYYKLLTDLALIVGGLALLVLGANWLVNAAVTFARWLQVSELIIGLTIVAIGTSLPEVVTSIVASLKGERDIAVGNVVGSNIFNVLGVLGLAAIVAPSGIEVSEQLRYFDLPIMTVVAIVTWPIFFTKLLIDRWEGVFLLAGYIAYTVYLILSATQNPATAML